MTSAGTGPTDLDSRLQQSVIQSRKQFVAAAAPLRPRLHRFCSRMCGSSLDGEDVVQETLAEAFYHLASLRDVTRFEPWIFRIAYHRCIDFLRRERRRDDEMPFEDEHDRPQPADESDVANAPIDEALVTLVGAPPPKERAAVLLTDVLDYPLAEVAEIADSTLGGAKAALHRGRQKLRAVKRVPAVTQLDVDQRRLFTAYAECFNRRDWDALRHLVRADARLEIVREAEGRMAGLGATYSDNGTRLPGEWRLAPAMVDGSLVVVHSRRSGAEWKPYSAIRLWWEDGHVVRIRDYIHIEYALAAAHIGA